MSSKFSTFFKSSDARSFLFFLLLTSLLAVLIKLSKEYTQTYELPVRITEVPIDKTIKKISPSTVSFKAQQSGFRMLTNSFKERQLNIKFGVIDSISNTQFSINSSELAPMLEQSISGGTSFSSFNVKNITVDIDVLSSKKVPVQAAVSLDFKSGYNTIGNPAISPDSVKVVGALGLLNKITSVRTKPHQIVDVDQDIKSQLELDTLGLYQEVKLSHSTFVYTQEVAKFTEGSFAIPVTIRGARQDEIKIFPKEVTLFFVASLDEYDAILPTDFEVIADFSTIKPNEEFAVLTVSRQPTNVRNVRLETKQIKFLVVH